MPCDGYWIEVVKGIASIRTVGIDSFATTILCYADFCPIRLTIGRVLEMKPSSNTNSSLPMTHEQFIRLFLNAERELLRYVMALVPNVNGARDVVQETAISLGRTVKMKRREHGWQTLKVSMEIPAGTRNLVIYLGAGTADNTGLKNNHYVDAVQALIVIKENPK